MNRSKLIRKYNIFNFDWEKYINVYNLNEIGIKNRKEAYNYFINNGFYEKHQWFGINNYRPSKKKNITYEKSNKSSLLNLINKQGGYNYKENNNKLYYINKSEDKIENDKLTFFIVRHINNNSTKEYWLLCYETIREFYPENYIYIIDDNSNKKYRNDNSIKLYNAKIIDSEYKKRGEILGYYYFYKLRPSNKALIIHDSVFFNKYVNFDFEKCKFLWSFKGFDNYNGIINLIKKLNNSKELLRKYQSSKWVGCFGIMSTIEYEFLHNINLKYNFFYLLKYITNRSERMNLERVFAVLCFTENNNTCTYLNNIFKYTKKKRFSKALIKNKKLLPNLPIIKVWTGR